MTTKEMNRRIDLPTTALTAHRSPVGKDACVVVAETLDGVFATIVRVPPSKMTLPKMSRLWTEKNGAFSPYDLDNHKFRGPSFIELVIV